MRLRLQSGHVVKTLGLCPHGLREAWESYETNGLGCPFFHESRRLLSSFSQAFLKPSGKNCPHFLSKKCGMLNMWNCCEICIFRLCPHGLRKAWEKPENLMREWAVLANRLIRFSGFSPCGQSLREYNNWYVITYGRDSDDSVSDFGSKESLGNFLHLLKNHGRDLLGGKDLLTILSVNLDVRLGVLVDNL